MKTMLHTNGILKVSPQQEFACIVFPISSLWKKIIHFLCIEMASPQYESTHVSLSKYSLKTPFHTSDIVMASSQYECAHACLSSYSLKSLFHTPDICSWQIPRPCALWLPRKPLPLFSVTI